MDTEDGHTRARVFDFDAMQPWLSTKESPPDTAFDSTMDSEGERSYYNHYLDSRFNILQPRLSTIQPPQPRHVKVQFESPYSHKRYQPGVGYLNDQQIRCDPPPPKLRVITDEELCTRLSQPRHINDQELWEKLGGLDTECQDCLNRRLLTPTLPPPTKPKGILKSHSTPDLNAARCSCFNCGGFWMEEGCLCKPEVSSTVPRQDYRKHQLQSRATSEDLRSDFNFDAPPERKESKSLKSKAGRGIEKFWKLLAARRGH